MFFPYTIFIILLVTFSASPFGKCRRVRWSDNETVIIKRYFSGYIDKKSLPNFREIQDMLNQNPGTFNNRNLASIKSWVSNQIRKRGKMSNDV